MSFGRLRSRRFVLRRPGADGGRRRLSDLVRAIGWTPTDAHLPGRTDPEQVWRVAEDVTFHHVLDQRSGLAYVEVRGSDSDRMREALERVRPSLEVRSQSELLEALWSNHDETELPAALLAAGLGAPLRFAEDLFLPVSQALDHPDPGIREAALWALAYTEWPEWRTVVTPLGDTDPDPRIKAIAHQIVELFDELTGGRA